MKKVSTHGESFSGEQILAISDSKTSYLVTPEDTEYLEVLRIKEITFNHTCETIRRVNTSQLSVIIMGNTEETYNLFDLMCNLKEKLGCTFQFKFNSKSLEIMVVCIYPGGNILACFIIGYSDNMTKAYPIFMDDEDHSNSFQELL